ncbi:MAG: hypothetical protein AMS18_07620 [Gemmatimonas sp. SG8_17]|nr:MAG: hypothetical protein AMS18_07620 [Gemmatimonas sp. SG8_17]
MLSGAFMLGCGSQDSASSMGTLGPLPHQIDGWTRSDFAQTYNRQTIFDYINGAGEVYRSYAFGHVTVVAYTGPENIAVTVELFDMGNPSDAYGVFSYGREREETGIGGGYEHRGGVLCFWQNRFYVCIASEPGAAASDQALVDIARAISEGLPAESDRPNLVRLLPAEGLVPFSERFFHLQQTLNYHYYVARENLLKLNVRTTAVLARYRPGAAYLLIVSYENESAAADAWLSFRDGYVPDAEGSRAVATENGKFVALRTYSRFVVVVFDAESEAQAEQLAQAALDRLAESMDWGA